MTDILVVGAGSAGANAALQLAKKGHSVRLIDRRARGKNGAQWVNSIPPWCFDKAGLDQPVGPVR